MFGNDSIYEYIALKSTKGISDLTIHSILSKRSTLNNIFDASFDELYTYGIQSNIVENILAKRYDKNLVEQEILFAEKDHINIITYEDDRYPKLLKEIAAPPSHLYCMGDANLLANNSLAIIGSRKASKQAEEFTRRISSELADVGLNIVSGFAFGIDIASHLGAITKGKTIAVLGSGLLDIYPKQHVKYVEQVIESGAIVSEFGFMEPPTATNFPRRNRIISGLSLGVLVIEASPKSGSLITCRYAVEQNREVFAVPAFPSSFNCAGNKLIKDGAKLVESYLDIVQEFAYLFNEAVTAKKTKKDSDELLPIFDSDLKHQVYKQLQIEPLDINELCLRVSAPVIDLLSVLTELELEGYISKDDEERYFREEV